MAKIIKPDSNQSYDLEPTVFLAGSIEMGAAEDWQKKVEKALARLPVVIFNPRRDDWDSSWEQSITNPEFNHQVNWEMDHLEDADFVFFYFAPDTKSPISLLELGLQSGSGYRRLVICCPDGFWRKGNVDIVCKREGWEVFTDLDEAIDELVKRMMQRL